MALMQLRLCITSAISFMQRPSDPGYLPSMATKQRLLYSSLQIALRGCLVLIIEASPKFSTLLDIICLLFTKMGPAPIPSNTFQCSPVSLLATGPGKGLGNLNLQVSKVVPYEQIYSVSNWPVFVSPKAPTVGWFLSFQFISFLLITLPFSAMKEAETFSCMLKYPPLRTAQTTFCYTAAYCSGVLGKQPKASPFEFFTTNSKFVSFILNLAIPPVSFVPNGELVVFRIQIYTDAGSPRFISAGLVQLQRWDTETVRSRAINRIYTREIFIRIILSKILFQI